MKYTAAQKSQLMSKLLGTLPGRKKIAASMTEPLRKLRDYVSSGRKAFFVDELPDGAMPVYDQDVDTPAYVVTEQGDSIQGMVNVSRIMVPLFELASNPKIPFAQVKERRFDVIRRIKQKAKDELFRKEDNIIFSVMSQVGLANTFNAPISVAANAVNMATMADAFARVERWGLRVDKIYMNPQEYKIFRKAGRDYMDFETQRELLRTGFMGLIWGAAVYMSMEVTPGQIHFITEPDYYGVMPIRIDLTVVPADVPGERAFGWSVFENLGLTQHNAYGHQLVVIS